MEDYHASNNAILKQLSQANDLAQNGNAQGAAGILYVCWIIALIIG